VSLYRLRAAVLTQQAEAQVATQIWTSSDTATRSTARDRRLDGCRFDSLIVCPLTKESKDAWLRQRSLPRAAVELVSSPMIESLSSLFIFASTDADGHVFGAGRSTSSVYRAGLAEIQTANLRIEFDKNMRSRVIARFGGQGHFNGRVLRFRDCQRH